MKRLNRWILLKRFIGLGKLLNRPKAFPVRNVRLEMTSLESRITPTVVTISSSTQTLTDGWWTSTGISLLRSGGDTSQALTVNAGIGADGLGDPLATWNTDYTLTGGSSGSGGSGASLGAGGGTVTFAAGQSSANLQLTALPDNLIEGTEGFRVTVLGGSG